MITLYQYYPIWGLPSASPFCMKMETYLRMAKLPYENKYVNRPQKSPKGKLPHIKMDGIEYPDSELIIQKLKSQFGDRLDTELTEDQRNLGRLIDIVFCERIYWEITYLRWQYDKGWAHIKESLFEKVPAFVKLFIPNMVRKQVIKQLHYQGMGRHTVDEVLLFGTTDLNTMYQILGENKYFLGNTPSSVDATAFAFLCAILGTPFEDPLKEYTVTHSNLVRYCNRMWDAYYSDLTKPKWLF